MIYRLHSWIRSDPGAWTDVGHMVRALSKPYAQRIANRCGVVGWWPLRAGNSSLYPVRDIGSFADEIMRMCDCIGSV